jgi:gamma-glutamylcyclotransferase (GGCT)/AIG2-like uncharacterized protein YtfP
VNEPATVDLFVYGTLIPGERWWDVVERFVVAHRVARAHGSLYDTGDGYPAATFAPDDPEIHGAVLTLRPADLALARLDRFEGEEYERVTVRTTDGAAVIAYAWRGDVHRFRRISDGSWASSSMSGP